MPSSPRTMIPALGGVLVLAVLGVIPSRATEDFALTRVAGVDRYATAAAVALDAFATSASVVVARGDAFPDALAGAYLTGVVDAPLLLTRSDALPTVTSDAIAALGATKVYLLGGTSAISDGVAAVAYRFGPATRTISRPSPAASSATLSLIALVPPSR